MDKTYVITNIYNIVKLQVKPKARAASQIVGLLTSVVKNTILTVDYKSTGVCLQALFEIVFDPFTTGNDVLTRRKCDFCYEHIILLHEEEIRHMYMRMIVTMCHLQ